MTMLLDTFRPLDRLGRDLFSLADGALPVPFDMSVNMYRDGDRYVIDADLPGADPHSVDVTVEGRTLTIRAQRSSSTKERRDDAQWVVRERADWSFVRHFNMGDDIDPDDIEATYRDGVLTVVVPIARPARRHKVPVAIGGGKTKALTSKLRGKRRVSR